MGWNRPQISPAEPIGDDTNSRLKSSPGQFQHTVGIVPNFVPYLLNYEKRFSEHNFYFSLTETDSVPQGDHFDIKLDPCALSHFPICQVHLRVHFHMPVDGSFYIKTVTNFITQHTMI